MNVKLRLMSALLIALVGSVSAFAQRAQHEVGQATATIISPKDEFMGQGRNYQIGPTQGKWFAEFGSSNHIVLRYFANKESKPATGGFWRWDLSVDDGIKVGQFTNGSGVRLVFDGDGRGCDRVFGKFTISAFSFDCIPFINPDGSSPGLVKHLTKLVMRFEQQCDHADVPKLTGTISFTAAKGTAAATGTSCSDSDDGGGDTGGGDTGGGGDTVIESLQVSLPPEFAVDPAVVANATTTIIPLTTSTDGTFQADVALFATTDAQDHEDFRVELTRSTIPSPGIGGADLRILTGPSTFPRTYQVTITAVAGDRITSSSFLVTVTCDPPVILGIDQPKNISAVNGSQVTLEVKPSGSGPYFYQWFKGVPGMTRYPVLAANESKLIFTTRETATYWVRVSNACGSADSNGATVTTTGSLAGPARRRGGKS